MDIVKGDPSVLTEGRRSIAEEERLSGLQPLEGVLVTFRPRCEQGRHRYQQGDVPKDELLFCPKCGDVVPFAPDEPAR